MKRILLIVAYGVGGLVVAIGLTFGAFALAGRDISTPAGHIKIQKGGEVVTVPESTDSGRPQKEDSSSSPRPEPTGVPTEVADDHGGGASVTPAPTHPGEGGESEGPGDSGSDESSEGGGDD